MNDFSDIIYYKYNSLHDIFTPNISESSNRTDDYYDNPIITRVYHNNMTEGIRTNTFIVDDYSSKNDIDFIKDYNYLKFCIVARHDGKYVGVSYDCHDFGNTTNIFPYKLLFEYFI